MSNLIHQRGLYQKQVLSRKIQIPFHQLDSDLNTLFIEYAQKHITNQCEKEGYISDHSIEVVSYSAGKTFSSFVQFDVLFECMISFPYEGMTFQCKIQSITKIGIKGILSHDEKQNPFVVFASYLHNPTIFENDQYSNNDVISKYQVGDDIHVRVLGHRFEIHDPSIYVLAEIIEKRN